MELQIGVIVTVTSDQVWQWLTEELVISKCISWTHQEIIYLWYSVLLLLTLALGNECTDGSIRLRGGTTVREGRVEICIEGRWGTICDNSWDSRDASVVCRQLGYPSLGE